MNVSFLSDLLSTISDRGRQLIERRAEHQPPGERQATFVVDLAEQLLSRRGEASGVAIAGEILAAYATLKSGPRVAFFEALEHGFGTVHERLRAALDASQARPDLRSAPAQQA